jgi:CysZ protein
VRRLFYYLGGTLLIFMLACVPLIGAVAGPLAQLWFTARMLSWELLDVYFERRGLDYAGQRALLKAHRGAMFGFGAPWTLVIAVPIVGPLGFGLAQAAAALLVTEVLEAKPSS